MGRTRASRGSAVWVMVALGPCAVACLYDADQRCGAHQKYDGERCVCADGYGLTGTTCVECGENEVGSLAGCSCALGYARQTPTGPCEEQETLGQACTSDQDCQHQVYSYCHLDAESGYCTKPDCNDSGDCDTNIDYACNDRGERSFCERPAQGLGTPCSSSADCEGFEANYCEALSAKVCLPNDCKDDLDKCHGDWVCCDIALLRESICIPPSELESGACPAGGTLITRGG